MKQAALLTAVIVLAILSGTGQANAAGQASADSPADVGRLIDSVVPAQLEKYELPGAAVSVVSGGRQVFAKGYGYGPCVTYRSMRTCLTCINSAT
ncbi:hypothetical protein AB0I81_59565 [Nonomuraea sp. NPDC050404]|uniref:hypothetical protein n=1 Tax=Nonomuraea sp. NPDC050404 TaxID=3155783 RepID=UPI0034084904